MFQHCQSDIDQTMAVNKILLIFFIAHITTTASVTLADCTYGRRGCAGNACLKFCVYVVCSHVDPSQCFCSLCGYATMGAGTRSKYTLLFIFKIACACARACACACMRMLWYPFMLNVCVCVVL